MVFFEKTLEIAAAPFSFGSAFPRTSGKPNRLYFLEQGAPVAFWSHRYRKCYRSPCTIVHRSVNILTNKSDKNTDFVDFSRLIIVDKHIRTFGYFVTRNYDFCYL